MFGELKKILLCKPMFTGIVEETGMVKGLYAQKNLFELKVLARKVRRGTRLGDSIAVNGVCLTVTNIQGSTLYFDVMKETIRRTNLKNLRSQQKVNLERALKMGDRFGGHFVTGHIDGVGMIKKNVVKANYVQLNIGLSPKLLRYIIAKGSVCVNGISLTVGSVRKNSFSVCLIPHTLQETNLSDRKTGDTMNIETDIMAKYILDRT